MRWQGRDSALAYSRHGSCLLLELRINRADCFDLQHYSSSATEPVATFSSSAASMIVGAKPQGLDQLSADICASKASAKVSFTSNGASYSTGVLTRATSKAAEVSSDFLLRSAHIFQILLRSKLMVVTRLTSQR